MCGWTIVEGDDARAVMLFPENTCHGSRDSEIDGSILGDEVLVKVRDANEGMRWPEFQCENRVAEIVPVNAKGGVSEDAGDSGNEQSRN